MASTLDNLLSSAQEVHVYFDNLELWFEGTDETDCYAVCVSNKRSETWLRLFEYLYVDGDCLPVTFSSNGNARLPDPQLLALHAGCVLVVRISCVAETLNELECDVEGLRVLGCTRENLWG
ncbi:hypothetical protein BDM02DRAFT_3124644 [Thelephora ganbajun]|uniref:Uncharacterized protein n=1 Tax=Thelephora ganbajun TaxID=370292 RepID=A0ACB6YY71_THEGA|nr:hypothetical protein BDM02DRAFT_3124644 [Thelephora ganbajun]